MSTEVGTLLRERRKKVQTSVEEEGKQLLPS